MSFYVELINKTIEYIEDNINEKISLEDIAERFCISKFHFNRLFKTVSGMTLKQYILGRKLTKAWSCLTETNLSVIDVAYDFGFEYPEVFSRAFKKQFGVSPSICKHEKVSVSTIKKINIVERDIVNYKGKLTLSGTYIYLEALYLEGSSVEVDVNDEKFKSIIEASSETFLEASQRCPWLDHERLYTVVNCHELDNGEYTVYHGMERKNINQETYFQTRIIPQGHYARFIYQGDMFDIREAFIDDLYRWIMVKEVELNANGIGMLNIFEKDYLKTNEVQILIPIKNPI